jgi:uncharacterized protein YjbI with pentapeptide repeats
VELLGIHFNTCTDFLFAVHFEQCVLDFASFADKKKQNKKVQFLFFERVTFSGANLTNSVFQDCNLDNAIFNETQLAELILHQLTIIKLIGI